MKLRNAVLPLSLAVLLFGAPSAFAWQSTTAWGNGKTTSSSSQTVSNPNGTVTRNSTATGPNGNTGMRSATRGNGTAVVTRHNGSTRVTTRTR